MSAWFGHKTKPAFLSIDLETRSEVDIKKCGVYKYVEGEYWKILLFCYKFEGDEDVSEIDLASGEVLTPEILSALEDPEIVKYAWNASFERTNLSKYLQKRLDPKQWKCTMVWAAELSLPLSLKKAAEALHVDQQKDRAGDALIRRFSVPQKPSKANGMKTWLEPSDLPEQWAAFKSYCRQDVRTEDAIRNRLEKFPIPQTEWEMYWIDQDINDRGIQIDVDFAKAAMEVDGEIGKKLNNQAIELTGLENPNSIQQLQCWLRSHGVVLETLGKEAVQEQIDMMEKDAGSDKDVLKLLKLRLLMAKSSIKKYEAAVRCTCKDGRARGLFQFYGANRTGRFCLTGDHEVLTPEGWVRLDEWAGGKIACWSIDDQKISFLDSIALKFSYKGPMYILDGSSISQISTPEHKMYCKYHGAAAWETHTVREILLRGAAFIRAWKPDSSTLEVWETPPRKYLYQGIPEIEDAFDGTVYCAQTATGFFVVRRLGRVWITGNSGRNIQLQNLSKNHIDYLDDARGLIKMRAAEALDMLFDNVPDVLSQCVRTMLVPKPGHEFIVADFSAIEARCIAWEAGEKWTLQAFRDGKDLYCTTASQMFHKKVEKHGENAELRQKGKIAVLACGYGGSTGAMISMGALKMGLSEEEIPDIVEAYREANPNIVKFWWDLDSAAISCIRDHEEHVVGEKNPDSPKLLKFEFSRNVLWLVLPSGRKLAYVAPKIGKNRFGGRSIQFLGVGLNNNWDTIETYGAKLSENCLAKGTFVLTKEDGWKRIENINKKDMIWDGESWVLSGGAKYMGMKRVIELSFLRYKGIHMTPDHLILTTEGWIPAGEADGKCWATANTPDNNHEIRHDRIFVYADKIDKMPVYDILDCGPHHRFCVLDPSMEEPRIVHNCTQAIARDILCNSIKNLEANGIHVVAHVHDECICEVPIGKYTVDDICNIMSQNPEWCENLPLAAAGYLAPNYYFKD